MLIQRRAPLTGGVASTAMSSKMAAMKIGSVKRRTVPSEMRDMKNIAATPTTAKIIWRLK